MHTDNSQKSSAATKDRLPPERMEQLVAGPMSLLQKSGLSAAQKDFDTLLTAAVRKHGNGSVEEADLLTSFGVELFLDDIDEDDPAVGRASVVYLKRAIPAYRAAFGARHPEVAVALNSYADALLQVEGDTARPEAESALEEAYSIRLATLGPENGETKSTARDLASVREDQSANQYHPLSFTNETYLGLRRVALETKAVDVGLNSINPNEPYGVVMDMDVDGRTATVTSFANGDASLYLSTGGGTIGSGRASQDVAAAARQFVAAASSSVQSMGRVSTQPLPGSGEVIFYVLTPQGIYAAKKAEQLLDEGRDILSPLFFAGQEVLRQIRRTAEEQDKGRQEPN